MSEPDAIIATDTAPGVSTGVSVLTGLDQAELVRVGGPMAELTDEALYAEIASNRRAEYRLVGSAAIALLAIAALLVAHWLYLR